MQSTQNPDGTWSHTFTGQELGDFEATRWASSLPPFPGTAIERARLVALLRQQGRAGVDPHLSLVRDDLADHAPADPVLPLEEAVYEETAFIEYILAGERVSGAVYEWAVLWLDLYDIHVTYRHTS